MGGLRLPTFVLRRDGSIQPPAAVAITTELKERGQEAEGVAEAIRKSGGRAAAFGTNISLRSAVQNMIREVDKGLGHEIAQAVVLLVGNGYMTGQTIAVNGGALSS